MRLAIRAPYGRPAARRNPNRQQVSTTSQVPPPVGGWDTQSPIAGMPAERAVRLDNFIPRQGYVELRKGFTSFATGIGSPVQTLMTWRGPTEEKFFASKLTGIYEITAGGAVGAEVVSSTNNGRWEFVNFGTPGGQFLRAVNGSDTPLVYDGSTWGTSPSITGSGLNDGHLIAVFANKQRLFFIERESARFWYLAPNAIGGGADVFDLASIFTKGGHLVAGASWSIDGGAGSDDLAVFISSQGQVAIYRGIDPGSAEDWALVGVFDLAPPVSRRCFVKLGGDLGVITQAGFLPLQASLVSAAATEARTAISANINSAFQSSAAAYKDNFGWQCMPYDASSLLVINIPIVEDGQSEQYVMNSVTGAWCRWTGMSAGCWGIFGGLLYFGGNGTVYLADTGYRDNGAAITGDLLTAFSNFRAPGRVKHFLMCRPYFREAVNVAPQVDILTDFDDSVPTSTPTDIDSQWPTAQWGSALWGTAKWGKSQKIRIGWAGSKGIGIFGAVRLRMVTSDNSSNIGPTSTSTLQVLGFDVLHETGGIL